jgi:cubilin
MPGVEPTNLVFSVCGGVFSEPSAVLKSPFYPNPYPTNRVCIYEIELLPGQAVELCFQDFEVEDTFSPPCRYDYLEVSNVIVFLSLFLQC